MPSTLPVPWRVGQHVAIFGDTGSGKTYLMAKLAAMRRYVVVFRTKGDDISFPGFSRRPLASAMDSVYAQRILLQPRYEHQLREGYGMLERAWKQENWTIVIDEEWYCERLGLTEMIERLLTQGRSMGISVMLGSQRPSRISRYCIAEARHVFAFQLEGRDAKTVGEATTPRMVEAIAKLKEHEFAYFNRQNRIVEIGNARRLDRIISDPASVQKASPENKSLAAT